MRACTRNGALEVYYLGKKQHFWMRFCIWVHAHTMRHCRDRSRIYGCVFVPGATRPRRCCHLWMRVCTWSDAPEALLPSKPDIARSMIFDSSWSEALTKSIGWKSLSAACFSQNMCTIVMPSFMVQSTNVDKSFRTSHIRCITMPCMCLLLASFGLLLRANLGFVVKNWLHHHSLHVSVARVLLLVVG